MKRKASVWILMTALMASLAAGCGRETESGGSASDDRPERSGRHVVGEGILAEDITEFTYSFGSSAYPPEYGKYRFFEEDGTYRFSCDLETAAEDAPPQSGELTTVSGTLELTDDEWDELYDCLEGGSVKKPEEDRRPEAGGTVYQYRLYWNGDREKYREFSFASSRREREFEALCEELTSRIESSTEGERTARLGAEATPEEIEAFLANGSWKLIYGGWGEGPACPEMIFGADNSVTFRMPTDEAGTSYVEAEGTYSVSYETRDRAYPDLLTLSFDRIPDELPADYAQLAVEDAPTEDFTFYIAASYYGSDYLNLYITGNSGYSVIADRLFKEENQTSETHWNNENAGLYPVFDSGWVFYRYTEGAYNAEDEPEPKSNADFYAMIWEDGDGFILSYMNMEEHTDVFAEGDRYYYFSYDGAPEIVGYELDYDVLGDRRGNMPYNTGMGRMPCVMAHITTGADAKITSFEYFTYAGFMHWEKWTGGSSASVTNATEFTSFDEVLAYYREVLPTIKVDEYDESVEGTLAADLYSYYVGYWPEFPLTYFYYTFTDLTGDGADEMLVGTYDGTTLTIHQILAIGKQDGKVHLIASAGYRTWLYVHTDGSFNWGGSNSASSYSNYIYRLNDLSDMREFIEGYKYDDMEEIAGGPWYRAIPTGEIHDGFIDMSYEPITEEEALGMIDKYTPQEFRWSMLAE